MTVFLTVCAFLVPLSMIILGFKWADKPPENKDGLSGYRTAMSRINEDTWHYAHKYWGKLNCIFGVILLLLTAAALINRKYGIDFDSLVTYLVFIQLAAMVFTIIPTERKLNKAFDKNGNRK